MSSCNLPQPNQPIQSQAQILEQIEAMVDQNRQSNQKNENGEVLDPQSIQRPVEDENFYFLYLEVGDHDTVLNLKKDKILELSQNKFYEISKALVDLFAFLSDHTNLVQSQYPDNFNQMFKRANNQNYHVVHKLLVAKLNSIEKVYKQLVHSDIFEPKLSQIQSNQKWDLMSICAALQDLKDDQADVKKNSKSLQGELLKFDQAVRSIWVYILKPHNPVDMFDPRSINNCFIYYWCYFFFFRGYNEFKNRHLDFYPFKLSTSLDDFGIYLNSKCKHYFNKYTKSDAFVFIQQQFEKKFHEFETTRLLPNQERRSQSVQIGPQNHNEQEENGIQFQRLQKRQKNSESKSTQIRHYN